MTRKDTKSQRTVKDFLRGTLRNMGVPACAFSGNGGQQSRDSLRSAIKVLRDGNPEFGRLAIHYWGQHCGLLPDTKKNSKKKLRSR